MRGFAKASIERRLRLGQHVITIAGPGTILTDIETVIDFIGSGGLPTQSDLGNLPSDLLPELNRRLTQPIQVVLNRPLLRDYPNISGLYVLLRVMNLAQADPKRVWINQSALSSWSALNDTEKYFALLEAWLIHASAEVLGRKNRSRYDRQFACNLEFLTYGASSQWRSVDESFRLDEMQRTPDTWNIQLQARFGLVEVQPRAAEPPRRFGGRGWMIEKVRRTSWGETVAWIIMNSLAIESPTDLVMFELPEDAGFGFLQTAFEAWFPQWQKVYGADVRCSRRGLYIFKVNLDPRFFNSGGPWRRLAVPDRATLHQVADAILRAYKFDDEHLYDFKFRDQLGKARVYNHPGAREGPFATDITLRESGLPEKGLINFVYDYGDDWRFVLRLEGIAAPDKRSRRPKVIESEGRPPVQYPDLEAEGW